MKKFNIIFLFFLFSFLLFAAEVRAANLPFINKSKIRVIVSPGEQSLGEFIVENPTTEARSMRLYLEDWYYLSSADGAKDFVPPGSLVRSCANWITFSPVEFTISPFGRQRVSYAIKAPQQARGGYYAALFFETVMGQLDAAKKETAAGLSLTVRIASLFYVEAQGTVKRTASVENLVVKKDSDYKGILIQLDFANTGNVDITAGGTFHIMDREGVIYARGEFAKVYTFPGDKTKLIAYWKKPLAAGKYDLVLTLDFAKALEEVGLTAGEPLTKETEIEVGQGGEIVKVGELN